MNRPWFDAASVLEEDAVVWCSSLTLICEWCGLHAATVKDTAMVMVASWRARPCSAPRRCWVDPSQRPRLAQYTSISFAGTLVAGRDRRIDRRCRRHLPERQCEGADFMVTSNSALPCRVCSDV
jgi:hypothetical protein